MKLLVYGIAAFFLVAVVSALMPHITLFGVQPSLLAVIVLALVWLRLSPDYWWIAAVSGILADLISPSPFGTETLSLLLAVAAASYTAASLLNTKSFLSIVPLTFVGLLFYDAGEIALNVIVKVLPGNTADAFWIGFPRNLLMLGENMAYSLIVAALLGGIFYLLSTIHVLEPR